MSYRNPEIIKDTSGQIYGQAVANIGKSLAQGVATNAANRERLRKEAEAERKRTQSIGYNIQSQAYKTRNANYTQLKKTEPGLAEQFKTQTEALLMGNDEIGMGAIEARTLLATGKDLSVEEKQNLQAKINRYEVFQSGLMGNAGKIISETELYNNTSPGDFNNKYRWAGSNEYERTASQFAAAALSDQEIPGARYEKKLYTPTENGEQIVGVKIFVDPNDSANKGKYDNEELFPRNENGEIEIEWKKDLNKWDEGLLEEIEAVPDSIEIFKTAGITNEQGGFNEDQFLNISGDSQRISGLEQYSQVNLRKDINVAGWANNRVLQDEIKSKAAGYQGMRDDELSSFLAVKLNYPIDIAEFRKLDQPEQLRIIEKELNEEFIIQKTSGLQSRPAKEGDPGAVIDPITPVDGNGEPNYKVYFEGSESVKGTPPELSDNPSVAAQSLIDDFFEDPAQSYSTFRGNVGETAVYDEAQGEMRISGLTNSDGSPMEDEVFNFNDKNDIAMFAQLLLDSSGYVGKDAEGRKIRKEFTKNMRKNIDKYLKQYKRVDNETVAQNKKYDFS
jgi:hypothetical protein